MSPVTRKSLSPKKKVNDVMIEIENSSNDEAHIKVKKKKGYGGKAVTYF